MKTLAIAALVISVAAAQPALAQGTEEQRAACSGDAFRLCASSIPNVGRITACMREKRAQLSPGCRTVMDASDGARSRVATAPAPAPRVAERPRPVEREAVARRPAPPPRETVARRPAPPQRLAQREAPRVAPVSPRVAEPRVTPRPARVATVRETPRTATVRQSVSRRSYAGRARNSDFAQADYWMRRVTGFGLPAESASLASIGPLLR